MHTTFTRAARCCLASVLLLSGLSAQGAEARGEMKRVVAGQRLHYLLHTPIGEKPTTGWPLLLFLHGYGECGSDLDKVKKHGPPKLVDTNATLQGCVLVSPQCPRDSWWRVATLHALLEEVISNRGDIDRRRLYVTGLSMGGYGIWSLISRHPSYFAAVVPICGGGDPLRLPANRPPVKVGIKNEFDPIGLNRARKLPVWTFHGSRDGSVPIGETQLLVRSLKAAGSDQVRFTVYPRAGHVEAWQRAYRDPKVWKWLFAQRATPPRTE